MRPWKILSLCGLVWAFASPLCASAQTPTPSAARLATLAARSEDNIHGTVRVTPQGSGSMVDIVLSQPLTPQERTLTLMSGKDCDLADRRQATMVPLNPISGTASHTLVSIPFEAFSSEQFLVDVRQATSHAQTAEACAHL